MRRKGAIRKTCAASGRSVGRSGGLSARGGLGRRRAFAPCSSPIFLREATVWAASAVTRPRPPRRSILGGGRRAGAARGPRASAAARCVVVGPRCEGLIACALVVRTDGVPMPPFGRSHRSGPCGSGCRGEQLRGRVCVRRLEKAFHPGRRPAPQAGLRAGPPAGLGGAFASARGPRPQPAGCLPRVPGRRPLAPPWSMSGCAGSPPVFDPEPECRARGDPVNPDRAASRREGKA